MKIRMNFGIVKTVLIVVVFAGVLALIGLDIAILAGANGINLTSPAVPIVSLIAAVIVGVMCGLLLLNSYYKFKDRGLSVVLGVFAEKIAYDDVIMLKQNIETSELFMIVKDTSKGAVESQVALKVSVSAANIDKFLKELRVHIPNVTVELYSPPKKKKKDRE